LKELSSQLEGIGEKIRTHLSTKDAAREKGIPRARDVIKYCANAIRSAHRGEYDNAGKLLETARALLDEINSALKHHGDIFYVGVVHDAQKEYAEASITLALVSGAALPDPDDLGVEYAAYLNGMGEAVGELRRHLLDSLRKDDVSRCEEILTYMDDMYSLLVTMDYPDAITRGLRRTTDMVRGVLERTRGDLTIALRQDDLSKKLSSLREGLERKK